jgi:hypothetical protein
MAFSARIDSDIQLLVVTGGEFGVQLDAGIDAVIEMPGLTVAVERVGAAAVLVLPIAGEPLDLKLTPPQGARAALTAPGLTGGGYLARKEFGGGRPAEWAGALSADLGPVNVAGLMLIGSIGGSASFVAVLGIRFRPGIQLGFGFELTGVGGVIGVNRRADVDQLRNRLASGAAGNVLFCEDPIDNAPTILGDLAVFFPAAADTLILGPTLQISWLSPIVRLDAAILVQVPGPAKIVILGTLRVLIGASENAALLFLRMDFLGEFDFQQQLVSLDAVLVNSHALGVFRLTGSMAFRMFYGANPYVLLSIGGFHPRFDPGPLNLPALQRVGAVLDTPSGQGLSLRLELYTAFTPNTLQAGALVQARMRLGPLGAEGHFQFDGLITFRPFTFDIEFAAGLSITALGESFCSVTVSGQLTGPGPLVVHARASVKVLLVRVSGSATFELGARNGDLVTPVASVVQALRPELSAARNLHTEGQDPHVRLRADATAPAGGVAWVSPTGTLIWQQKRVPLDTLIDRFEGAPIAGARRQLSLTVASGTGTPQDEWFSPGSFTNLDLKASQSMNNAGYERLPGGIQVSSGIDALSGDPQPPDLSIDLVKLPTVTRFRRLPSGAYLPGGVIDMLRERDTTPRITGGAPKVVVTDETFDVIGADGATLHPKQSAFQAFQLTREQAGSFSVATAASTLVL